jgi:integrase
LPTQPNIKERKMLKKFAVRSSRHRGAAYKRSPKSSYKQPVGQQVLEKLAAGITDLRDRAIILFLMDTGLRVSELVQLDRSMIKADTSVPRAGPLMNTATGSLPIAKSLVPRKFYVSERAFEALNLYLGSRDDPNPALFTTKSGERLRVDQVGKPVHAWCHLLGVERFPLHDFRRRLATGLREFGCDPTTINRLLDHSRVETTLELFSEIGSKAK